jgi:hypothetical protein
MCQQATWPGSEARSSTRPAARWPRGRAFTMLNGLPPLVRRRVLSTYAAIHWLMRARP